MSNGKRRMGAATWKAALRLEGKAAVKDAILIKGVVPEVKAEGSSRVISFKLSDGSVDRDRDSLDVNGWDLAAYRKNPIVLFGHKSDELPIARSVTIGVTGGALRARAEFATADLSAFADSVFKMIKGGFLRGASVGFDPITYKASTDPNRVYGIDFARQSLLEWSVVPVPAHAGALAEAKSAGVAMEPLIEWAEKTLSDMKAPYRKSALAIARSLTPSKTYVDVLKGFRDSDHVLTLDDEGDGSEFIDIGAIPAPTTRDVAQSLADRLRRGTTLIPGYDETPGYGKR